jgi:glycine betaine/proline transport system substrate-binding protein
MLNEIQIKKLMLSIFLIFLLIDTAYGFAGMGGQVNNTAIPPDTTESDQDIIMAQHLIELDANLLKAENKLFIRETLIFRNIGSKDFFGSIKTWMPDGTENIILSRSELTTSGGMVPISFSQNGNIISWRDYIGKNSNLPFLYALEYSVKQNNAEIFSKKLAIPNLINYKYMEKADLPAIVIKIIKPEGNSVKFIDENGNKIVATEVDDKGEIFRFSSPQFNEINVVFSKIQPLTSTITQATTITAVTTPNQQLSGTILPTVKETVQNKWTFIGGGAFLVIILGAVLLRMRKPKEDAPRRIEHVKSDIHVSEVSDLKSGIKTSYMKQAFEILRGFSILPNNDIKFGIRLTNINDFVVTDVDVIVDYTKSLFSMNNSEVQHLGNISPNGKRTATYTLKPLGCIHNEQINALITYKDHTGKKQTLHMRPKEVHCVCPFLKEKPMSEGEYSRLAASSEFVQEGISFKAISVEELAKFMGETCRHMLYKVREYDIEGKKVIYLSGESVGEKTYYLLTAVIQDYKGLTQVVLRAHSDKKYGLNGFMNEMADSLRHLVGSVQNAKEMGIIENKQVINIIDSIVQRTSFNMGEEGSVKVNIKDSLVQRSNIGENRNEKY